jgi:hypothetical protein
MKKGAEPKAKPAKVVKLKSTEAEGMVLSYLNKQNRPYNSKMIFEVFYSLYAFLLLQIRIFMAKILA